jgi:hypothetical protein
MGGKSMLFTRALGFPMKLQVTTEQVVERSVSEEGQQDEDKN